MSLELARSRLESALQSPASPHARSRTAAVLKHSSNLLFSPPEATTSVYSILPSYFPHVLNHRSLSGLLGGNILECAELSGSAKPRGDAQAARRFFMRCDKVECISVDLWAWTLSKFAFFIPHAELCNFCKLQLEM